MSRLTDIKTLIITVGTNPLPCYITAKYFIENNKQLELILFIASVNSDNKTFNHTSTYGYAKEIIDCLNEEFDKDSSFFRILKLENVGKSTIIKKNIRDYLSSISSKNLSNIHLNYTAGTKAMSVNIYSELKDITKEKKYSLSTSYLDSRSLQLIFESDSDEDIDIQNTNISFSNLIKIHEFDEKLAFQIINKKIEEINESKIVEFYSDLIKDDKRKELNNFLYNVNELKNSVNRIKKEPLLKNLANYLKYKKIIENSNNEMERKNWTNKIEQELEEMKLDEQKANNKIYNISSYINEYADPIVFLLKEYKFDLKKIYELEETINDFNKTLILNKLKSINGKLKNIEGKWLDDYTYLLLSKKENVEKIKKIFNRYEIYPETEFQKKGIDTEESNKPFQIDNNMLVKGYQYIAVSCTIDNDIEGCKSKGFEVIHRSKQLGGDESKSILVSFLSKDKISKLEEDLKRDSGSISANFKIFGEDDLFNPAQMIDELVNFIKGDL